MMNVAMRVQPSLRDPLGALGAVLHSIESLRNGRALYLLLLSFAVSGLLLSMAQRAAAGGGLAVVAWAALAAAAVFYGSNAAGLVLMDEARGLPGRSPAAALGDALRTSHRLLLVGACALAVAALVAAAVWGLLRASALPWPGPGLSAATVALGVPALGLALLTLVGLVGPLAAPAVWFGLRPGAVLRLLWVHLRHRLAHTVLLAAAVSLLSAAVAALVSFAVLSGARALLLLTLVTPGVDLAGPPLLTALFGGVLRMAADAPPLSDHTRSALTGAGVVFGLGLVLPAVVYLRGLCNLFLALHPEDGSAPPAA